MVFQSRSMHGKGGGELFCMFPSDQCALEKNSPVIALRPVSSPLLPIL